MWKRGDYMLPGLAAIIKECLLLVGYISGGKAFPAPLSKSDEQKYIRLMEQGNDEAYRILKSLFLNIMMPE